MVGIISYGAGNIYSVMTATLNCGEKAFLVERPRDLKVADKLILPGVGAFTGGMNNLAESALIEPLIEEVERGKPFLGICLGLQLLFETSEEGDQPGFGLIKGKVKKFSFGNSDLKVPHMGWNRVQVRAHEPLILHGIPDGEYFYFAHSYYPVPEKDSVVAATTFYGGAFTSVISRKNIIGVQFHPEKSGDYGILFLKNFLEGKWLR